ncbi:MAG: hypothetical protein HDR92_02500 [Bacteroides sp.]|nr:hypothetical protein [Bacteroides sp.]
MNKIYTLLAVVVLTVLGALPLSAADYSAKLSISDVEIQPGATVEIPVTLDVPAAANATAVEIDIVLPEGISFVEKDDEDGFSAYFNLNTRLRNHTSEMEPSSPTTAKILIFSTRNANLISSADNVVLGSFYIKAADTFKGCGEITLSSAKVASAGTDDGLAVSEEIPSTVTDAEVYVPVEEISLSPDELVVLLGQGKELTPTFSPAAAEGNPVEWSSSDATIAAVDENGTVKALKVGTANITATSRGKSASCKITVNHVLVTKITIDGPTSLTKGETAKFSATVTPVDASDYTITWSSSDTEVATIDEDGTMTAVGAGTTTITATANDGSGVKGEATLNVVGVSVTSIALDKTDATIQDTETVTLAATIEPDNADNKEIEWTSSDEKVATVADGVVTGVAPGTATITAKALGGNDVTATCTITVEATLVEKIEITAGTPVEDFTVGSTIQLIATVTPENATDKTITWKSTDDKIATVDENGVVTAVALGSVVITATANDGSDVQGEITLEVLPVVWKTLSIDITEYEMIAGEELKMQVTGTPDNVTDKTLLLTCDPEGIVEASEIDENGNFTLTAVGEGEVTVTVKGADASEAEATATVKVSAELAITSSEEELAERSTITLTANTFGKVEWSIDNEEAAEIVSYGIDPSSAYIKGLKEGETVTLTATITLPDGTEQTASLEFTITEPKDVNAETITINPNQVTLKVGSNISLSAIITPSNCTNGPVIWSSQNSAIASVNNNGLVSALSAGTSYISATTRNFDGTALTAMTEINVIDASGIEGVDSDNAGEPVIASGHLAISVSGVKADTLVEVYNVSGQLFGQFKGSCNIQVTHSGVYIIRIGNSARKVIVKH